MPNNMLKSFSKKHGISIKKLENDWETAKTQSIKELGKISYPYIVAIVKKMNNINESANFNFKSFL
jgi:hypothetical protein